jgi:hypothetical protein
MMLALTIGCAAARPPSAASASVQVRAFDYVAGHDGQPQVRVGGRWLDVAPGQIGRDLSLEPGMNDIELAMRGAPVSVHAGRAGFAPIDAAFLAVSVGVATARVASCEADVSIDVRADARYRIDFAYFGPGRCKVDCVEIIGGDEGECSGIARDPLTPEALDSKPKARSERSERWPIAAAKRRRAGRDGHSTA